MRFTIYSILLLFLITFWGCTASTPQSKEAINQQVASAAKKPITIQVLGSGGPEFSKRASSAYLLWVDEKARVLIDAGGGAFLRFSESGAKIEDLSLIALTHLHIDHSADIPEFMKAGYFSKRATPLPILGPTALGDFPDIDEFLTRLFSESGAFAYMKDILTRESASFQIVPTVLEQGLHAQQYGEIKITSVGVHHGIVPAIAYAIEVKGKKIVFAGDTSAETDGLINLAKDADYLIVHHAIPQGAGRIAKKLHITPSRIGEVAAKAQVKNLILSHRMIRTYDREMESLGLIKKSYQGNVIWAEDLMVLE